MVTAAQRSQVVLKLHLLGPPQVEAAGHALDITRRQVRALLYVLGEELEPVPRAQLCFLFWPDIPEPSARRNLSHLLTHLRGRLPTGDLIHTSGDVVALDRTRVWSDSAVLLRRRVHSDKDLATGAARPRRLLTIAGAYRGPFLEGFSLPGSVEFELWTLVQQRACERAYLRLLDVLIEHCASAGDLDAAIRWSQRQLDVDPLAEEAHRRLIQLYAATGDGASALRQFERCTIALERELGVRPLPETRDAYEAVLHGRTDAPPRPRSLVVRQPPSTRDLPLVGRDAALDRLRRAYAACRAGTGGLILISGEAGIGKSRLMAGFAREVSDEALVVATAGQVGAERLPYRPVVQILRTLLDLDPHATMRQGPPVQPTLPGLPDVWLAELARLIPELRIDGSQSAPVTDPSEARVRLVEAVCRAIGVVSETRGPLVLCLDDLQWMDAATLDWLLCLAEDLDTRPCLVVATYRIEDGVSLSAFRDALARRTRPAAVALEGLDGDAVLQLVEEAMGTFPAATIPPDQRRALAARLTPVTGGNPFFILEILRTMADAGQLQTAGPSYPALPLPDTIRQAVSARLRRLGASAAQVLEAGAILGGRFGLAMVTLTSGRDEMETMDGLDELVARHLLVEHNIAYTFHHEAVRQVVEAELSSVRRQLLHRRAGQALAQLGTAEPAAIAEHYELANAPAEALVTYARAVTHAASVFAWEAVAQYQERMLMAIDRLDPGRDDPDRLAQRGEILADRAHTHFLCGRLAARDADLRALAALAEAAGDPQLRLLALVHRVRYLNLDAHYAEALAAAQAGLDLATDLGEDDVRSRLLAQIGFAHYFLGQPRPALSALQAALATLGDADDPARRGRILHILGYVHFHLGAYATALACQREARACHRTEGDLNRVAWDGLDVGAAHLWLGDSGAASDAAEEHLALARQIGSRPAEAYGLTLLGRIALHQGDYTAAVAHFEAAAELQRVLHSEHGIVGAELGIGLALSRLGAVADARQRLSDAARQARAIAHRRRLAEVLHAQGLVEVEAASLDTAQAHFAEGLALARAGACWEVVTASLAAMAGLARRQGDLSVALDHARAALTSAETHLPPGSRAWAEAELGLTLLADGDATAALTHTARAVALIASFHEAWIGTEVVHHAHARVLHALDRDEAAAAQRVLVDACLARKADRIVEADQRKHYLAFARRSLTT